MANYKASVLQAGVLGTSGPSSLNACTGNSNAAHSVSDFLVSAVVIADVYDSMDGDHVFPNNFFYIDPSSYCILESSTTGGSLRGLLSISPSQYDFDCNASNAPYGEEPVFLIGSGSEEHVTLAGQGNDDDWILPVWASYEDDFNGLKTSSSKNVTVHKHEMK